MMAKARHTGKSLLEAKKSAETQIKSVKGVIGIGMGEFRGRQVINIYVVRKSQSLVESIESILGEAPVRFLITGRIRPLAGDLARG